MKTNVAVRVEAMMAVTAMVGWIALCAPDAAAHCDTMAGPVIAAAKAALEKGDITPILKWIKPDDESAVREAFQRALTVRTKGPEAKELADLYFFETLVRIHRAGEGAPYTGLKPAGAIEPIVVASDKALDTGNVDEVVEHVTGAAAAGIKERFNRAMEAKKHADASVAAGREFVEAYVIFMHYVEGLHQAVTANTAHHGGGGAAADQHGGAEGGHKE